MVHFGEKLNIVIHSSGIMVGKQLRHVKLSKNKDCSK